MSTYQGQKVTSRPATASDAGFDASKGPQVVITMPNGSTRIALATEVTEP